MPVQIQCVNFGKCALFLHCRHSSAYLVRKSRVLRTGFTFDINCWEANTYFVPETAVLGTEKVFQVSKYLFRTNKRENRYEKGKPED